MNKKLFAFIKNPGLLIMSLGHRGFFKWVSDEAYLKTIYRVKLGKKLNLNPPVTFNEKIQWLKLHDRKPEYSLMVDKYEAKGYVAEKIGDQYIIPTLGIWDRFDDIDFDALPNQFVLKCTHDSGGLVICKDKEHFKLDTARRKINECLKHSFYWGQREWPYKDVKHRIIAEKYMSDENGELNDYKFFCFDGVVKFFKIDFDRHIEHHANYYDCGGNLLPFGEAAFPPVPSRTLEMPSKLKEMIRLAETLSKDHSFLRVDFYEVQGRVYFGELTFYPASGLGVFTGDGWDEKLGEWIKI